MTEPVKLYDPCESMPGVMRESAEGGWVDVTDFASLEQECERLRNQLEEMRPLLDEAANTLATSGNGLATSGNGLATSGNGLRLIKRIDASLSAKPTEG